VIVFVHPFTTVTSVSWLTVAPLQASLAVGGVNDGEAVHSIVALPPAASDHRWRRIYYRDYLADGR
jgi:hypothetical protein